MLRTILAEGRTVIVSTHVMHMVEEICDRVGIIFDGKLHGDAPPRDLLKARNARTLDDVFFQLAAETEGGH
jgi:ABC-type multidrug transport system ATPase subunit